jgi:hypothetical protein
MEKAKIITDQIANEDNSGAIVDDEGLGMLALVFNHQLSPTPFPPASAYPPSVACTTEYAVVLNAKFHWSLPFESVFAKLPPEEFSHAKAYPSSLASITDQAALPLYV